MNQQSVMLFDPATCEGMPYPSHAKQYRDYHFVAWLYNPWTGVTRNASDILHDPVGLLIVSPGDVETPAKPSPSILDYMDQVEARI